MERLERPRSAPLLICPHPRLDVEEALRHSCWVLARLGLDRTGTHASGSSPPKRPGLSLAEMASLPTSHPQSDDEKQTCSICLDAFAKTQTLITLPCFHKYHESCIREWLGKRNSCPQCRLRIAPDERVRRFS